MKKKDAYKLFFRKETKELQGKKRINFFILIVIFVVAILAVGFGSASLDYLSYKMEDPFINWIDIITGQTTAQGKTPVKEFIEQEENQKKYLFVDPQGNYVLSQYFRNIENEREMQLQGRSISANSAVMDKILDGNNLVVKRQISISDNDYGLIITYESLLKLGYTDIPKFVVASRGYDSISSQQMGVIGGIDGNYPILFPVIAVVKQLPGMYSFLFTKRYLNEVSDFNTTPFDILSDSNNEKLLLVGKEEYLNTIVNDDKLLGYNCIIKKYLESWSEELYCLEINSDEYSGNLILLYNELYRYLLGKYPEIKRIYKFNDYSPQTTRVPNYYSIQMTSLDSVQVFCEKLFEVCGIKLEMTSIEAKENFRFVQRMGNILSYIIIGMSVLFIGVFIYFLLSSHFQKIQRNLGTFKAFGISNKELSLIYMLIMSVMIVLAFVVAIISAELISLCISFGFGEIEVGYDYVNIFVWQNLLLLIFVVIASIISTMIVSAIKLKHTPGDLIYNRK